jgi:hypothetical protein
LIAVMIWRVMHSSAKARKLAWCSGRKSRVRLVQADQRLLLDVVGVAAHEEVAMPLGPSEPPVAVDEGLEGLAIAFLGAGDQFVVGGFGQVPAHGDPISVV